MRARARSPPRWRKAYTAAILTTGHARSLVTVIAAARLAEAIDAERRELLEIVDKGLAAALDGPAVRSRHFGI